MRGKKEDGREDKMAAVEEGACLREEGGREEGREEGKEGEG